jgi:hypothetical protein
MMSGIQGGNFWNGFSSGALSSLAGSAMEYLGGSFEKIDKNTGVKTNFAQRNPELFKGLTYLSGSLAGGAGAELAGGNFWKGATNGLMVVAFNDLMHMAFDGDDENNTSKRSLTPEERQMIGKNYPDYVNYPDAESVYKAIGGPIYQEYLANPKKYVNTCAIRLSVAFEKSGIDIGGEYLGKNGLHYYTSATQIGEAIDSRFISSSKGFNLSNYGVGIQYKNSDYKGSVYHVDVVFIRSGKGVFGHTLYSGYYNKFY